MIKILLPTDFSPSADSAARLAIEMSKQVNANITFFHLLNNEKSQNLTSLEDKNKIALSKLNDLTDLAVKSNVKSDYIIQNEVSLDYIEKYATDQKFDLIILGYKAKNDTHGNRSNSFAKHLVSTSNTPVLVLKKPLEKIKKAALLSDFNEEYIINESWINGFITKLSIELSLVCINTPSLFFDSRTMMNRIERFQKHYDVPTKAIIYNDYQFGAGIKHLSEDLDLDLIIMNTHGVLRREYPSNSITQQVVAETNCSILCLPVG